MELRRPSEVKMEEALTNAAAEEGSAVQGSEAEAAVVGKDSRELRKTSARRWHKTQVLIIKYCANKST